jgi:hypothetical protein
VEVKTSSEFLTLILLRVVNLSKSDDFMISPIC